MELQHTYDIPGSGVVLLVTDSLLLTHHPSSGRTGVVDVHLPAGQLLGSFLSLQAPEGQTLPSGEERTRWWHQLPSLLFDPANGVRTFSCCMCQDCETHLCHW